MRRLIIGLVAAFALYAPASAQVTVPESGLGPYRFSMSRADIEGTSPNRAWVAERGENGVLVLRGGPVLMLAGARFRAALVLKNNSLNWIVLSASAQQSCANIFPAMLSELEPDFGVFDAAPGAVEDSSVRSLTHTAAGSEIRVSAPLSSPTSAGAAAVEPVATHYSTHRGGMFIQASGALSAANADDCAITLTFSPPSDPLSSADDLSFEELDRAETFVGAVDWATRPGGQVYARHYPPAMVQQGISGRAVLSCLIEPDGSLRCLVADETPRGGGFGEAALRVAHEFNALHAADGRDIVGKRLNLPITFRVE